MGFDSHTLELLQFSKIREMVSQRCFTSLGKELAQGLDHLREKERIVEEIQLVTEMVRALDLQQVPPFSGLSDIRLLVRRASIGAQLSAEQLLQISDALVCTGHMYRYRMRLPEALMALSDFLADVEDFSLTAKAIQGCIDGRGNVLDMASPELAAIRVNLSEIEEKIQTQVRRIIADPEVKRILRYPHATFSGDHCVLPVAANFRQKLPGVIHRTSSTGDTLYIEPHAVAKLSSERAMLKAEESREIGKILRRLSGEVGKISKGISFTLDILAKLDFVTAKAKFSRDFNMAAPRIGDDGEIWLKEARHPILQHHLEQNQADSASKESTSIVPMDIRLGDGYRVLIITGPNTGGKTVCLKTAGILCAMALSGMHVSAAAGCKVPLLENIFADIGDEQSIEQSLSTFSSHISRITTILSKANDFSLVLLDEMGAGTDPSEGAALGRAILDGLGERKSLALVTTHLGDLKTYALQHDHALNAAVEFDLATLRPTYRLLIGQFGMSNALRIAKRLGFPKDLLMKARKHLRRKRKGKNILKLQQELAKVEQDREEDRAKKAQILLDKTRQEEEIRAMEREQARQLALENARKSLKPGDMVLVQRFDKQGAIQRVDFKKGTAFVNVGLGQWEIPLHELIPNIE